MAFIACVIWQENYFYDYVVGTRYIGILPLITN